MKQENSILTNKKPIQVTYSGRLFEAKSKPMKISYTGRVFESKK